MMEPALCTTSTSTDGADVPMSIKQEPGDGPQIVLQPEHSSVKFSDQQHLTQQKFFKLEECKNDIPIINMAPMVTSGSCGVKAEEDNVTVKSEPDECGVVPDITENLYEVKNELPCPIHNNIVHNNRLDVGSELVEVKGELDFKSEIVDNVALGDVNIQTSVQHNDTVNQTLCVSTNNCDIDMKEETELSE